MQFPPVQPPAQRPEWLRLLLRWLISSLAIFAAIWLVPGIEFTGPGWQIGVVALVFGLLNSLLRPLLYMLTCPLVLLSLGLFGLVINGLMLGLTSALADQLNIQFHIDGFWTAFLGGLVISLVTTLLTMLAEPSSIVIIRHREE